MRWPLLLISIFYLSLLLAYAWVQRGKFARESGRAESTGDGVSLRARMSDLVTDTHRVYALLAVGALLSIAFGKPERILQAAAWAVLGLQGVKAWGILGQHHTLVFVVRILVLALLALIFILQLPVLDAIPR